MTRKLVSLFIFVFIVLSALPAAAQGTARTIPTDYKLVISALSPDGKTLAIAASASYYDNAVTPDLLPILLFDPATGKQIASLEGTQTDFTSGLAFSPNGEQLVSTQQNGELNIWNVSSAKIVSTMALPFMNAHHPVFLPDGKHLAVLSSGTPSYVVIIDLSDGAITASYGPRFQTYAAFSDVAKGVPGMGDLMYLTFAFSPDGKTLATANDNDEVDLWDVASHKMIALSVPDQKQMMLGIQQLNFTPDGKKLLYHSYTEKKLHIWDLATQKDQALNIPGTDSFALSAKGDLIAWLDGAQVYTWDFKAAEPTKIGNIGNPAQIILLTRMYFTPDAKSVIITGLGSMKTPQIYVVPVGS